MTPRPATAAGPAPSMGLALFCGALIVLLGIGVTLAAWSVAQVTAVFQNWDFWTYARYAAQADPARPATLLPGFWGMGFPLLLRAGTELGFDALRTAHAVSAITSGVAVILSGLLAVLVTRSWVAGVATAVVVALMEPMLILASGEFNIPPGNAFALAGLAAVIASVQAPAPRSRLLWALAGGIALGIAAMFRHQVLALLPVMALALLVASGTWRLRLGSALAVGAGVAIGFGPELAASLAAYGVPLYSTQAKNIWLVTVGQDNFANWGLVPDTISWAEVAAQAGWTTLLGRWWEQFLVALTSLAAWPWPWPLHLAVLGASVAVLLLREFPWSIRILLAGAFWAVIAASVTFRPETRLLLLPAMTGIVTLFAVAWALLGRLGWTGGRRSGVLLGLGAISAVLLLTRPPTAIDWFTQRDEPEFSRALRELTREARLGGASPASIIVGNKEAFHLVDDPRRLVFTPLGRVENVPILSPDHYIVVGTRDGSFDLDVRSVLPFMDERPGRYAPLAILDWARIYCTSPCEMPATPEPIASWDNGLRLMAQRPTAFQGERGLLLYWQTDRPLDRSLKLSLRLLQPDGTQVWQEDAIPALNRYPTTRWQPGEIVVDAHRLPDADTCPDCRLVLLVYDETTNQPLTPAGQDSPFVTLRP